MAVSLVGTFGVQPHDVPQLHDQPHEPMTLVAVLSLAATLTWDVTQDQQGRLVECVLSSAHQ